MHTPSSPAATPTDWDQQQRRLGASFLQASSWVEFQKARGHQAHYLSGSNWTCLLIEDRSKFGRYLFAPYGPTVAEPAALTAALKEIAAFGRQLGVSWVRIEPSLSVAADSSVLDEAVKKAGLKIHQATKQINPLYTRIVDIEPDTDAILAKFSQTNRRLVRQNYENSPLTFQSSRDPADIERFLEMMHIVSARNKVFFHSDDYFRKQAQALMKEGSDAMWLEFAFHKGKPIASIIMHSFGEVATYTYAASLPEARDLSAAGLLLWQAIVDARAAGIKKLDLFGVAPPDAGSDHPWHGFSAFKKQFGGEVVQRGRTYEIPLKSGYTVYRLGKRVKRAL